MRFPRAQYARDYLQALGSWDALQGRLLLGGDVGAVLAYARRGEVAAAIVYATEARGLTDIVVLDEAKGPDAPRPVVVAGAVRGAPEATGAEAFSSSQLETKGRESSVNSASDRPRPTTAMESDALFPILFSLRVAALALALVGPLGIAIAFAQARFRYPFAGSWTR